jgi:hypothetical protein
LTATEVVGRRSSSLTSVTATATHSGLPTTGLPSTAPDGVDRADRARRDVRGGCGAWKRGNIHVPPTLVSRAAVLAAGSESESPGAVSSGVRQSWLGSSRHNGDGPAPRVVNTSSAMLNGDRTRT